MISALDPDPEFLFSLSMIPDLDLNPIKSGIVTHLLPSFVQVFGICCPDPDSKPTKSPIPTLQLNSTASTAADNEDDIEGEFTLEESKLPFHCGNRENIFIGGDDVPDKQPFFPSIVGVGSGVQGRFS